MKRIFIDGFTSTVRDGRMPRVPQDLGNAGKIASRNVLVRRHGFHADNIVQAGLVHGVAVYIVNQHYGNGVAYKSDAMITSTPGVVLAMAHADCPIVSFRSEVKEKPLAALAHAGRESALGGIIMQTVGIIRELGINPRELSASISPAIRACCYELKEDEKGTRRFQEAGFGDFVEKRRGSFFGNLPALLEHQLKSCGVRDITDSRECTCCQREDTFPYKYFSFRRQQNAWRNLTFIGINEG